MADYKLIENLRRYRLGDCPGTLAMVAADEIERLRNTLKAIRDYSACEKTRGIAARAVGDNVKAPPAP